MIYRLHSKINNWRSDNGSIFQTFLPRLFIPINPQRDRLDLSGWPKLTHSWKCWQDTHSMPFSVAGLHLPSFSAMSLYLAMLLVVELVELVKWLFQENYGTQNVTLVPFMTQQPNILRMPSLLSPLFSFHCTLHQPSQIQNRMRHWLNNNKKVQGKTRQFYFSWCYLDLVLFVGFTKVPTTTN